MRRLRLQGGLLVLAGWLALVAQAGVALQAGWHHHGPREQAARGVSLLAHPRSHAGHDHSDNSAPDHEHQNADPERCALCAALHAPADPVGPEEPAPPAAPPAFHRAPAHERPAFLTDRPATAPRGPPCALLRPAA